VQPAQLRCACDSLVRAQRHHHHNALLLIAGQPHLAERTMAAKSPTAPVLTDSLLCRWRATWTPQHVSRPQFCAADEGRALG
jgi:hypothetical protein